jgi:hypothetical protein
MTTKPAAETAAAVRVPEIADAIDKPAKINVITRTRTTPKGVLTISTIEPAVLPLPISRFSSLP